MELYLPFLFCRLWQAQKDWKGALQGFFQDAFITSQFWLLYALFPHPLLGVLWVFLALYQWIGWYLDTFLGIPLTRGLWKFALQPFSFADSLKDLKVGRWIALACLLIGLSLLGLRDEANPWLCVALVAASGVGSFWGKGRNPLFVAEKGVFVGKEKGEKRNWEFPGELCQFLDPAYPLLRKTVAYLGKKRIATVKQEKPHLIFLILESFRAKNVGSLGANVPLSPHFDRAAGEGALFTRFHSASNLTSCSSIASLFGIPPAPVHGNLGEYAELSLRGLPRILKEAGYHPALLQGGHVAFDHGPEFFQKHGYETLIGKRDIEKLMPHCSSSSWGVHDEHLLQYAAHFLEKQSTPSFLTLFTITNHHPWSIPPHWTPPQEAKGTPYLESFAYTDWVLGLFLEELKKKGLLEKSILFIFGDHGQENRGEHFEINRHLYQENVHVPLLLYAPGRIKGERIDSLCSQIDLLPTVLDLLELPAIHHSVGTSLLRQAPPAPLFFSHPFDEKVRGVRQENWKLILEDQAAELYDLDLDPEERQNLAGKWPEKVKQLQKEVDRYQAEIAHLYEERSFCKDRMESKSDLQLEFADSLDLDDEALEQISSSHPQLSVLSIRHCLLLSDAGFEGFFRSSHPLEKLTLQGLDEITGDWPEAPYLMQLKVVECSRFRGVWLERLPSLRILQLGIEEFSDEDLSKIRTSGLWALQLTRMEKISDAGLKPILERNRQLTTLSFEYCPHIGDKSLALLQGTVLCQLSFAGLPHLTDDGLKSLSSLPIQHLTLQNCPQITGSGLSAIQAKGAQIWISQCPNIDREQIESLSAQGMKIWWDERELAQC